MTMSVEELRKDQHRRWLPTLAQDAAAAKMLAEDETLDSVFTIHVLAHKTCGFWTADVQVIALPGVFRTRKEALDALAEIGGINELDAPHPMSAGYAVHYRMVTDTLTCAHQTDAAVFEFWGSNDVE